MKKNIPAYVVMTVVMVICPWFVSTFIRGDAAMAICFVLFFGLNPQCSLMIGVYAGLDLKGRWYLPLVNAGLFLLTAWLLFSLGERAFLGYAGAYLAISVLAMLIGAYVRHVIRKSKESVSN